jgi:hypothetical protein
MVMTIWRLQNRQQLPGQHFAAWREYPSLHGNTALCQRIISTPY